MAKKNTTDRASKLVSGFIPPAPTLQPPIPASEPEPKAETFETTQAVVKQPTSPQADPVPKATERRKRGQAPASFVEVIIQALPAGIRCNKPIMLAGEHHKLLRELSFVHNKPMTEILYNLLESATQTYQRDQQSHA